MRLFGISIDLFGKKSDSVNPGDSPPTAASNDRTGRLRHTLHVSIGEPGTIDMPCKPGRFYVYRHRGPDGKVFYVGKGTGDRAWSKYRGPEHAEYLQKFCGGTYEVEIVRKDVCEEDALRLEDILMREHGDTIVNLQNLHAPYNSSKLLSYSDAMTAYRRSRNEGEVFAAEGKVKEAIEAFEQAYSHYQVARDNADYDDGARSRLDAATVFGPPTALIRHLGEVLVAAGLRDQLVALADRVKKDWGLSPDDRVLKSLEKATHRAERVHAAGVRVVPRSQYVPPENLPPDWERAKEGDEEVIRLKRALRPKGFDYLDTVERVKQLQRERQYEEALALMKPAIISAERESSREKMVPPPFYTLEAAKACHGIGGNAQECLFLHRYDVLARRYSQRNPQVLNRLTEAFKLTNERKQS